MNNTIWIWDVSKLSLVSLLIQKGGVKNALWDSVHDRLAFCTGNKILYLWSPKGASCVHIPIAGDFLINGMRWSPSGNSLVLMDKDQFCICYFEESDSFE
jgi:WD40 repeat protein